MILNPESGITKEGPRRVPRRLVALVAERGLAHPRGVHALCVTLFKSRNQHKLLFFIIFSYNSISYFLFPEPAYCLKARTYHSCYVLLFSLYCRLQSSFVLVYFISVFPEASSGFFLHCLIIPRFSLNKIKSKTPQGLTHRNGKYFHKEIFYTHIIIHRIIGSCN